MPSENPDAQTFVNGSVVTEPTVLHHVCGRRYKVVLLPPSTSSFIYEMYNPGFSITASTHRSRVLKIETFTQFWMLLLYMNFMRHQ